MNGTLLAGIREFGHYRTQIAIFIPLLGGGLALASSLLAPRGKAKGMITGLYLLLTSIGAASLLFACVAVFAGVPRSVVAPLLLVGIVLSVVMGIFSPEIIREYQHFEFRKLAAEIFRRS